MDTPTNFDPVTGQPIVVNTMQPQKKSKKGLIIGIIIGVLVLAAAVAVGLFFLLGKDPKTQVSLAITNTAKEFSDKNLLFNDLSFEDYDKSKERTATFEIETEIPSVGDVSVSATSSIDDEKMQVYGDVNVAFIPSIKYVIQLDKDNLSIYTPLFDQYVFNYGYNDKNSGFIAELLKEQNVDLNDILSKFYELAMTPNSEEANEELFKSFLELGEKLEFEKTDSKEYEIDGKDVDCKGYKTVVSGDDIKDCIIGYYKSIDELSGNMIKVNGMSYSELMEMSFENAFDNLDEFEVVFYLYDDKVAGLTMQPDDEEMVEIAFKGGDYRAQNIDFLVDDEVQFSIEGEIDDDVETYELALADNTPITAKITYNSNDGELTLAAGPKGQEISLDFIISKSKNKLDIEMKTIDFGDVYFGGKLSLSTGAKFEDIDAGTVVDLGNASEEELQGVVQELYSIVMGTMGF